MDADEGRFTGSGYVHSPEQTIPVSYDIEVWRERLAATRMGGSTVHDGLLDMVGSIQASEDLFDMFQSSDTSLELEDGRKIGMLLREVDFISGIARIVMNGGWLDSSEI